MEEKTQKEEAKKERTYSSLLLLNEIRRLQERQEKAEREIKISNRIIVTALVGIITFSDIPIFWKTWMLINAWSVSEDFREGIKVIFSNLKSFFIKKERE